MSILLSVNPPFAGWLVDGEKTIEWRKKPLPVGKAYIYETKKNGGCGKVIGEIFIAFTRIALPATESDLIIEKGKVDRDTLDEYRGGKPIYANCVYGRGAERVQELRSIRYSTPLPLSEFKMRCKNHYSCAVCEWWNDEIPHCRNANRVITRPPQSWMYAKRRTK